MNLGGEAGRKHQNGDEDDDIEIHHHLMDKRGAKLSERSKYYDMDEAG